MADGEQSFEGEKGSFDLVLVELGTRIRQCSPIFEIMEFNRVYTTICVVLDSDPWPANLGADICGPRIIIYYHVTTAIAVKSA